MYNVLGESYMNDDDNYRTQIISKMNEVRNSTTLTEKEKYNEIIRLARELGAHFLEGKINKDE